MVCASWESQCWGDGDRQATLDSQIIWIPRKWKTLSLKKGMNFKDVGFLRNYRQGCPLALPQTCVHVHLHTYEHIQTHMAGGERMHHMNLGWRDMFEDSLSMWLQLRWVLLFIYLFTHLFLSFFYLFYSLFLWVYAWCGREGPGYISYTWRPEDNCEIRSLPSTFPTIPGIKPRLPGLYDKYLYPLTCLAGSEFILSPVCGFY